MNNQEKEISDIPEIERLPTWLQLTICISLLLISINIGITTIGKAEYNQKFCEGKVELLYNEKASLFEDQVTKVYGDTAKRHWGCCRIPEGAKKVLKKEYCVYTPEYQEPKIKDKFSAFLKRFK